MDNVWSLCILSLKIYLSDLPLCSSLIRGMDGGSTCGWVIPIIHPFVPETFFFAAFFFLGDLFGKCHTPYVSVVMNGLIVL